MNTHSNTPLSQTNPGRARAALGVVAQVLAAVGLLASSQGLAQTIPGAGEVGPPPLFIPPLFEPAEPPPVPPTDGGGVLTFVEIHGYAYDQSATGNGALVAVEQDWIYFYVSHDGWPSPASYQWRKNGQVLSGAADSWLNVGPLQQADAGQYSVTVTVGGKSITSAPILLQVLPGLSITQTPANPVLAGSAVAFTAAAPGAGPLAGFQWRANGGDLPKGTNATLTLAKATMADAGKYSVSAFYLNLGRRVYSDQVRLLVYPRLDAPIIATQPRDQTGRPGGIAVFTVGAAGAAPFSYQWQKGGTDVSGATNFFLVLRNLQAADAADYRAVVRNGSGTATSAAGRMTIANAHQPGTTANNLVASGRAVLAQQTNTSLSAAAAAFTAALTADPDHELANLFAGITRVFDVLGQPAANQFLDRLQWAPEGRNVYHWKSQPKLDADHHLAAPPGVNANELPGFLRDQFLPQMAGAVANLARIKDLSFTADLKAAETTSDDLTVDQGDLHVVRALLGLFQYYVRTINSWNLSAPLTALKALADDDLLTIDRVLRDYPQLLTFADPSQVAPARAALEAAIDDYVQAAGLVRGRQAGLHRLFNLDPQDERDEARFRQGLLDLKASLAQVIVLNEDPELLINFGRLADGTQAPRTLLPAYRGNHPDPATLPDKTLGGAVRAVGRPQVVLGPADREVPFGSPVTLGVVAVGAEPLSYQWFAGPSGEFAIPGATNATLSTNSFQPNIAGPYRVVVSNAFGADTSGEGFLAPPRAPTIRFGPFAQTVVTGSAITLSVDVSGTEPFSYQWRRNGQNLPGATHPKLSLAKLLETDTGDYDVVVTNLVGSARSAPTRLTVLGTFFFRIGLLPGGQSSQIRAASADGATAVGNAMDSQGRNWPVVWRLESGLSQLPTLPYFGASTRFITASDITPDGEVIAGRSLDGSGNNRQAVIWRDRGRSSPRGLGVLAPNAPNRLGAAGALSADGSVVYGWATSAKPGIAQEVFRWTEATGMVPLGVLRPSDDTSFIVGRGASADGNVAVGFSSSSTDPGAPEMAMRYTPARGLEPLGLLPGGTRSGARAVSADGKVILGVGDSAAGEQLFLWTEATGATPLGRPEGFTSVDSGLLGLSRDGQTIAFTAYYGETEADTGWFALLRNANGFVTVDSVLRTAGLDPQGLTALEVLGMSGDANILYGEGTNPDGSLEGWVARLPAGLAASAVQPPAPPFLTQQPADATVIAGSAVTFSAQAANLASVPGSGAVEYQWFWKGQELVGATGPTLTLAHAQTGNAGDYTVAARNAVGSVLSRKASLTVLVPTPGAKRWEFVTGGPVYSSPALGPDGTVYVGSVDSKVYALDGVTGAKRWEFASGGAVTVAPALGPNGNLYLGSDDRKVYALDVATGAKRWEFTTGGIVRSSPALGADGTVYVGSQDGRVYALDGATGSQRWNFATSGEIYSSPAVGGDGTVYFGSRNGKLVALAGTSGVILWQFTAPSGVDGPPAIGADGRVYFESYDGRVYSLNGATGLKRWEFSGAGGASSPAIALDGTVLVGSDNQRLYALDGNTGAKRWEFLTSGSVYSSPALGADGTVYVGSRDGQVYALDGATGTKRWQFATGGEVWSSPALGSDGTVYVGSIDGRVYALFSTSAGGLAQTPWPKFRQNNRNTGRVPDRPPVLSAPLPATQDVGPGGSLTLTATATGTLPLSYQWRFLGADVPGATSATLALGNLQPANAGDYSLVIRNLAGAITSAPVHLTVIASPDLLGLWQLNESAGNLALDYSGYGHHGVVSGAGGAPVWTGGALRLDGASAFVAITSDTSLDFTGPITLSAWIKPQSASGLQNIIAHGHATNPGGEVTLRILDGLYQVASWDGRESYAAGAAIPAEDIGVWVHLAGVFDGSRWLLYRNGTLANAAAARFGAVPVSAPWALGARGGGGERLFRGSLAEARVYARALSATEVAGLAGTRTLPQSTDIVWLEDATPAGARLNEYGGEDWQWVERDPLPISGRLAHVSPRAAGLHQHYFSGGPGFKVKGENSLVAYVNLVAAAPPRMLMLQWQDEAGSWEHRVFWGADLYAFGGDGPATRHYAGPLPGSGRWTRLEVAADAVGLGGHTVMGLAFTLFDGAAAWDHVGSVAPATDEVWVGDALPPDAFPEAAGGDDWSWVSADPTPYAGTLAHRSKLAAGLHQHWLSVPLTSKGGQVGVNDSLVNYLYLDPANLPSMVLLQWFDGTWNHRAYWGEDKFSAIVPGVTPGTAGLRDMGPLPPKGQWVRLSVPAGLIGLENSTVRGLAFTLFGGQAYWDNAGKATPGTPSPRPRLRLPERLPGGEWRMELSDVQPGRAYVLERSANLLNWTDLVTNRWDTPPFSLMDNTATGARSRFYRVRLGD